MNSIVFNRMDYERYKRLYKNSTKINVSGLIPTKAIIEKSFGIYLHEGT